jgi:hypothetical protein
MNGEAARAVTQGVTMVETLQELVARLTSLPQMCSAGSQSGGRCISKRY